MENLETRPASETTVISGQTRYELWEGTQALDVMKKMLKKAEYVGYLKGNIIKYQNRLGKKQIPGMTFEESVRSDMDKIEDYQTELSSVLEG